MSEFTAPTLLRLSARKIDQARLHTRGYQNIHASLGERTARWAYADRGVESGHRGPSKAEDALRDWLPSIDDWCLVLSGTTGVGKTVAAARYVAERDGLLLNAVDADKWGFGGGEALAAARAKAWLLIDDMGDEKTSVGSGHLATLIAARAANGKRTVITTTYTPTQLMAKGDHLTSRLRPYFVQIADEPDRRSKAPPFLRGISRQFEIVRLVGQVEIACSLPETDVAEAVIALAKLVGIDLDSEDFKNAVEETRRTRERINATTEEFFRQMATRRIP